MKPSMFNFVHQSNNGDMFLYNSLMGTKSLVYVNIQKSEKVTKFLNCTLRDDTDPDYLCLVSNRYLVGDDVDETQLRAMKFIKTVSNPELSIIILPTEKCNFSCSYCYVTVK
jgi:uncharacterized protein